MAKQSKSIGYPARIQPGGRGMGVNPPVGTQKAGVYVKPGQAKPKGMGVTPKAAGGKGKAMTGAALKRPPVSF